MKQLSSAVAMLSGKRVVLALGASVLLSTQCSAATFWYNFVNGPGGFNTPLGAVVEGRMIGNFVNNQTDYGLVTVTVDSISTGFAPGFAPTSWTQYGVFVDVNNHLTGVAFSANNGTYSVNLDSMNPPLSESFALATYTAMYQSGGYGDPNEGKLNVPDGGATAGLLGLGLAGLGWLRRRL